MTMGSITQRQSVLPVIPDIALHYAAYKGEADIIASLLSFKADVNAQNKDENDATPLHEAASRGHKAIVETLLKAGAIIDARKKCGSTPLHVAAGKGHTEVVEVLLQAHADKEALDEAWYTPLHKAAAHGHGEVVEVLFRAGAYIDHKDRCGMTPLSKAFASLMINKAPPHSAPHVIQVLLLEGNASLKNVDDFFLDARIFFSLWGFDISLFESTLAQSKKLGELHSTCLIEFLETYSLPKALAQLIIEYHTCLDIRIMLFERAKLLVP